MDLMDTLPLDIDVEETETVVSSCICPYGLGFHLKLIFHDQKRFLDKNDKDVHFCLQIQYDGFFFDRTW